MKEVTLIVEHGSLHTPKEVIVDKLQKEWWVDSHPILLVEHLPDPVLGTLGGDHDTISWPNPNMEHLRSALFDAREMGLIPDEATILLPDGTEVSK